MPVSVFQIGATVNQIAEHDMVTKRMAAGHWMAFQTKTIIGCSRCSVPNQPTKIPTHQHKKQGREKQYRNQQSPISSAIERTFSQDRDSRTW